MEKHTNAMEWRMGSLGRGAGPRVGAGIQMPSAAYQRTPRRNVALLTEGRQLLAGSVLRLPLLLLSGFMLPSLVMLAGCVDPATNTLQPFGPTADTNTVPKNVERPILKGASTPSGFLTSYADLTELRPGVKTYRSPELGRYALFMMDPVDVRPTRTVTGLAIPDLTRQRLAVDLRGEIVETLQLAGKLAPNQRGGPGIARIHAAITELARSYDGTPLRPGQIGGATVEAEIFDSVTGRRLGAILASELVSENEPGNTDPYADVRIVFQSWAARLNKWLDAEQPASPAGQKVPGAAPRPTDPNAAPEPMPDPMPGPEPMPDPDDEPDPDADPDGMNPD